MRELIKTIKGTACAVYAISHHNRIPLGTATPEVKVYEKKTEVKTIGANSIRHKSYYFSVVIGSDPEMDSGMTEDTLRGLTHFDLDMRLLDKENTVVPFAIYGANNADMEPGRWVFQVDDLETVQRLMQL